MDGAGSTERVRLAITLGDPRGIGPEVAEKAIAATQGGGYTALVIGPEAFRATFANLAEGVTFEAVDGGNVNLSPGRAAGLAIEGAAKLALGGEMDAVVTAPIHKPGLARAGYLPGHTEMLTALSGATETGMLMCDEGTGEPWGPPKGVPGDAGAEPDSEGEDDAMPGNGSGNPGRTEAGRRRAVDPVPWQRASRTPKRVLLATIHVPLARVPELVTVELLVSQTRLLAAALNSSWGLKEPRIALCALNPHASDGGLFGCEERDVYAPALAALAGLPGSVKGPLPADTVFARAFGGEFDAVVAPYHDVGMAAFKTAAFGRGVNVTLGLPFVRTSPDHGTAFDIAGRNAADPSSMIQAIRLAARLAHPSRTQWRRRGSW